MADKNEIIMKVPCPFCGNGVRIKSWSLTTLNVDTEAECLGCGMEFTYSQDFVGTLRERVAITPPFEEIWSRRVNE